MSSILDQLELKPVPQKKVAVKIVLPKEGQVEIKAQIVDKRDEGYDRKALLKKLKRVGFIAALPPPATTKPMILKRNSRFRTGKPNRKGKTTSAPSIKKLKGKFRLGKKIQKGTITGLTKLSTRKVMVKKTPHHSTSR